MWELPGKLTVESFFPFLIAPRGKIERRVPEKEDLQEIEFDFSYRKLMGKQKKISSWFLTICFLFLRAFCCFLFLCVTFFHPICSWPKKEDPIYHDDVFFLFFVRKKENLTQFPPARKKKDFSFTYWLTDY